MSKIRVVLVEDHNLSRVGLVAALKQVDDIEVVGDAENGRKGLEMLRTMQPDVGIIDIGLPDIDGIELTQQLRKIQANLEPGDRSKVLILTMHEEENSVLAAFAAGADSYSLKDASLDTLVQAVRSTYEGNAWIDPNIARIVLKQARTSESESSATAVDPITTGSEDAKQMVKIDSAQSDVQQLLDTYPLTERELEVLELIVGGCSNAEISEKLYVTVGTVKTHVRSILNKLCVEDRTQAAVRALRSGLVS
ncbi:bacterial regulatory s, luxR family protein [Lyngbya aestuarii BL J]|uniref:Bacterial regulatory s, luxR family protein n=1 Tax=Lyngbya aestuarii BL J TaxID=1348334 RepID=U7QC80_9CYAN|nr:response regulator transcription factor [Lyngbya aestuarii]ERT05454.1 bacterial regulatory s, luxR family protein [Lyngbya aestuarii BL J]